MSPAAEAATPRRSRAGTPPSAPSRIGLHSLRPAPGSRRPRKRVGRGEGSGTGKTSGRGQKGYGSRSGAKDRARFEGGQMPIHMRMRKLRGPHKKQSMPFEPFRTHTQPVNLADLDARFEAGAEVTLEALQGAGLGTRKGIPVKILARGELGQGPDGARARLQRDRARAHRGRGRQLRRRREAGPTPRLTAGLDDQHDPLRADCPRHSQRRSASPR